MLLGELLPGLRVGLLLQERLVLVADRQGVDLRIPQGGGVRLLLLREPGIQLVLGRLQPLLPSRFLLAIPGRLGSRHEEGFLAPGRGEGALQPVVVAGRDGVVLVVVAARAAERQAEEGRGRRDRHVVQLVEPEPQLLLLHGHRPAPRSARPPGSPWPPGRAGRRARIRRPRSASGRRSGTTCRRSGPGSRSRGSDTRSAGRRRTPARRCPHSGRHRASAGPSARRSAGWRGAGRPASRRRRVPGPRRTPSPPRATAAGRAGRNRPGGSRCAGRPGHSGECLAPRGRRARTGRSACDTSPHRGLPGDRRGLNGR